MPRQHLLKLLLAPRLSLAEILCLLRLLPAGEVGRVLRHLGEMVGAEAQSLERDGHVERAGAGVAQAQDAHGPVAVAGVEEVDGAEFRGRVAEDGGDDAVDEDFGVALLDAEGRRRGHCGQLLGENCFCPDTLFYGGRCGI